MQILKEKSLKLSSLAPATGMLLILDFYQNERADGCEVEEDGDMLLYQWGCYDWGEGEWFQFDITRQFIDGQHEDEDIRQLSLTFKFSPTESLRKLKDGSRWCHSPDEIDAFRSYIELSSAYKAISKATPAEVSLELQVAG
jgi:hypothetical protein